MPEDGLEDTRDPEYMKKREERLAREQQKRIENAMMYEFQQQSKQKSSR